MNPRITALSILINVEGIHWFTLFQKSGVKAKEYINTISNFILSGLKMEHINESTKRIKIKNWWTMDRI